MVKCMGGLDILVNGAGILNESCKWTQMIETNVVNIFFNQYFRVWCIGLSKYKLRHNISQGYIHT